MKTTHSLAFFLLTCLMPLLAPAQSTVAAPGKPAKAGTAAVAEPAKPKPRLLTRDQLRRCFQMADDNRQEKAAIDAEIADFEKERAALEGETAT
ncbi:MAG: hypothetical protein ACR2I0_04815, partial [Rhodoferax sp.]